LDDLFFSSALTLAELLTSEQFSIFHFCPALKNYLKPVRGSTPDMDHVDNIMKDKRRTLK